MIEAWSAGDTDEHMNEAILVDLNTLIHRHPWWQARSRLVRELLRREGIRPGAAVLDAGCGWGVTLLDLEKSGYAVAGMDLSAGALHALDGPGRRLIQANLTEDFPTGAPTFDAVLALDVIEHLDDDRAALARLATLLRPGGLMVVSVPAQPRLFTEFDAIQGHRRRYLPDGLRRAFDGTGIEEINILWWGEWLVRVLSLQRKKARARAGESAAEVYRRYLKLPPWPLPRAFEVLFRLEQSRALAGRLQTGTSLVAIGKVGRGAGGPRPAPTSSGSDARAG